MDCTVLCLISAAVAFTPTSDIQKCTYCLDVRGITDTCNHDILECAKNYPDMVLYCLTISSMHFDSHVSRTVRCRSHTAYNVSLAWTEEVMNLEACSFTTSKTCDCSTCPFREEAAPNPLEFQQDSKHRHHTSKTSDKKVVHPNRLHASPNHNKTYLLTKGMAENIRVGGFFSNGGASLHILFSSLCFFVVGFIIGQ